MKKLITTLSVLLIAGVLFAETGYDIMKKADEVPEHKKLVIDGDTYNPLKKRLRPHP